MGGGFTNASYGSGTLGETSRCPLPQESAVFEIGPLVRVLVPLVLPALIEALAPPPVRLLWVVWCWVSGEAGGGVSAP